MKPKLLTLSSISGNKRVRYCIHSRLQLLHTGLLALIVAGQERVFERLDKAVFEYNVGVAQIIEVERIQGPTGNFGQV